MTLPAAAVAQVVAHLGGLHPFEQALVLLVAFGPFAVLGVVVVVMRRRDLVAERANEAVGREPGQPAPPASQETPT